MAQQCRGRHPRNRNDKKHMPRIRLSALLALLLLGAGVTSPALPLKAETLLEKIESPYNTIFVYDQAPYVTLAFGHKNRRYVESRRNPADLTELPVSYTRAFTIALAYPENLDDFLMIGMGGGSTSWYIHDSIPTAKITAVELDPEIIKLSEKYYDLREAPRFKISALDGRVHILRNRQKQDVIFIDAYRGSFVPFHLMTQEFFALAKKRLKPGGVVAQNIEPSTMLFDRSIVTMLKVFEHVDLYGADGNMVAIGYDGPKKQPAEIMKKAEARQGEYDFRYNIPDLINKRAMALSYDKSQPALTDDFAPVNVLKEIKSHNKKLPEDKSDNFFFNE